MRAPEKAPSSTKCAIITVLSHGVVSSGVEGSPERPDRGRCDTARATDRLECGHSQLVAIRLVCRHDDPERPIQGWSRARRDAFDRSRVAQLRRMGRVQHAATEGEHAGVTHTLAGEQFIDVRTASHLTVQRASRPFDARGPRRWAGERDRFPREHAPRPSTHARCLPVEGAAHIGGTLPYAPRTVICAGATAAAGPDVAASGAVGRGAAACDDARDGPQATNRSADAVCRARWRLAIMM